MNVRLSNKEVEILKLFRALSPKYQEKIIGQAEVFFETDILNSECVSKYKEERLSNIENSNKNKSCDNIIYLKFN